MTLGGYIIIIMTSGTGFEVDTPLYAHYIRERLFKDFTVNFYLLTIGILDCRFIYIMLYAVSKKLDYH